MSGLMCIAPTFNTITLKLVMTEDSFKPPVCPLPRNVATMSSSQKGERPGGSRRHLLLQTVRGRIKRRTEKQDKPDQIPKRKPQHTSLSVI